MTADDHARAVRALEAEFGELFSRTRRLFAEAAERVSPGMHPATYRTLSTIVRRGPITATELAEAMTIDKSHISRMVKDLTSAGFVQSSPDPADGRVRLLSATPFGREKLEAAREPMRATFASALTDWSVADIDAFRGLLHALVEGIVPDAAPREP